MDSSKDSKRRRDRNEDDEDRRRERKSKRARSRQRSPTDNREKDYRRKRRHSKSRSPEVPTKQEKEAPKETEVKKEVPERRAKETDMLNTRTGGAYIPPARLRMMQAQITDKSSMAYQRLAWEALKKSIHGHINKINVGNIGIIIKELLKENIVRGRGLLCRSIIQAQAASPTFTNVYAALVSAVNSRFPNIGELLLKRLVIQFKRGFKRNDKPTCISSASFIAHLVNQRVAHEILALELLTLLVETPTDDSVEVAIAFLKECGQKLTEVSSKGVNGIFEMLRNILHEGQLDKRVQYMIEVMFQVWKDGFKDHPALIEELELMPEEEQFTHLLMLDDATDPQDILNVFKLDEKYEENEQKYKTLSKEILGSDAESGEEDGSEESGSEEDEDDDNEAQKPVTIIDNTETNLVALRRTIYLTINSSLDFEECAHKLMKMQLKPGQEVELCHMFLDCCAEQRTYEKFYGLLAQRFCNINRIYIGPFEEVFKDSYSTAHRLDTNRLRNVSKFFAHLLFTDSISWEVLECVKLNEEDTTSSSRIYIKILFQELAEYMGLKKLNDRLQDPTLQEAFAGIFPRDNPKNTRFSINFFTSIGLGGLTDELREHLKQMPKNVPAPITEINLESGSSSDSSSSSSSDSSSSDSSSSESSDAEEETNKKKKKEKSSAKKKKNKTPKTPEGDPDKDNGERWGHDGFYDTYGKDAQRLESRPDRQDRNNFAKPWDRGSGRNRQDIERSYDPRNGDDRRHDGRNDRNERDKRQEDDRNNRHERDKRQEDGRSNRNERDKRQEEDRNDRNERDKRQEEDRKDRARQDRSDKDRNERDEQRTYRSESRRDNERSEKDNRNSRTDDSRYTRRRENDTDRHGEERYDRNRRNENERSEEYRNRRDIDRKENRRDDREKRDGNEKSERDISRRNESDRNDKNNSREKRDDNKTDRRVKERDDTDRRRDYDNENDNKRDKKNEFRKEREQREERNDDKRRNSDHSSDDERLRQLEKDKKNLRDKENSKKNKEKIPEKRSEESRVKKADRKEKVENSDEENREKKIRSKKKDKKNKKKESDSSEDSTSEESSPEKKKKKNKKRNDTDESSSEEDERRKKDKKRNRDEKMNSQEWNILSRDTAKAQVVERYWDNHDYKNKKEKTENREKRRDR